MRGANHGVGRNRIGRQQLLFGHGFDLELGTGQGVPLTLYASGGQRQLRIGHYGQPQLDAGQRKTVPARRRRLGRLGASGQQYGQTTGHRRKPANRARFEGARFEGAQFEGAQFEGAQLEGAQFEGAQLQKSWFRGLRTKLLVGGHACIVHRGRGKVRFPRRGPFGLHYGGDAARSATGSDWAVQRRSVALSARGRFG
ncbi:MAG: pentapeptide repeat-containing protein [Pirellulales bacterium]|nr:pentapeptide repeat-containing protein [Pirellulales bacterium]